MTYDELKVFMEKVRPVIEGLENHFYESDKGCPCWKCNENRLK